MISAAVRSEALPRVLRYSEATVPTEYGPFRVLVYREALPPEPGPQVRPSSATSYVEHMALVRGDVSGDDVMVRVHSECWTGEVLHSLKCECREQLDYALRTVAEAGRGAVLYLRQEGRGIGLGDKIRAYALQERGVDTVDANRMLGLPDDTRRYHVAAFMCADLGIRSVRLLTNNPEKVRRLRADGVPVRERLPVHVAPNEHNQGYLLAKSRRMGHALTVVGAADNAAVMRSALEGRPTEVRAVDGQRLAEVTKAEADDTKVRALHGLAMDPPPPGGERDGGRSGEA
jgi:GTP cyclohydrolase II